MFIPFPSINQYRHVIRKVKERVSYTGKDRNGDPLYSSIVIFPILQFRGTVKLHGTNAGIAIFNKKKIKVQSRNNNITPGNDNAGFAKFVYETVGEEKILDMVKYIGIKEPIIIYGEWCGEGIQRGTAINQLPKMFVIFAVRYGTDEDTEWFNPKDVPLNYPEGMFSIDQFPTFQIDIDFNNPEKAQNKLIELTDIVEAECPVGKALGVSGVGEGIVWRCAHPKYNNSAFWFKVKGEKHSSTKVKKLAEIDIEKLKTIDEFVDATVTEARLLQALDYLKQQNLPITKKLTGDFIRWVYRDIRKEEQDRLTESGLSVKDLGSAIGKKIKIWFFKYLDREA